MTDKPGVITQDIKNAMILLCANCIWNSHDREYMAIFKQLPKCSQGIYPLTTAGEYCPYYEKTEVANNDLLDSLGHDFA